MGRTFGTPEDEARKPAETPGALSVEDRTIAGHARDIRLRLYRPATAGALPGVLYFHGGGFTSGSIETAEAAAAGLAQGVPALVVSVGYSLAPDHPFPTAALDAYRAARWTEDAARMLGVSGPGLGVAGHDAGGHVAVSLTLIARDQGDVAIAAQALLAPMLDPSLTRARAPADGAARTVADCARCYRAYLPDPSSRMHPYAAPLDSRRIVHLPPALVVTAQDDVLRAEAEGYAARLVKAGIPTEVARFRGVSHATLPDHPAVLSAVSQFLRRHLAGGA